MPTSRCCSTSFILGILAQLKSALTLQGIAGIVLTMGMAVDANVLIYERIKEELALGRKLREAIEKALVGHLQLSSIRT